MRRLLGFLGLGAAGLAILFAGLLLDAALHAADPGLAAREGLVALSNPGHVGLAVGIGLAAVGLVGAGDAALRLQRGTGWRGPVRRVAVGCSSLLAVGAMGGTAWAGTVSEVGHDDHHSTAVAAGPVGARPGVGVVAAASSGAVPARTSPLVDATFAGSAPFRDRDAARGAGFVAAGAAGHDLQLLRSDTNMADGRVLDPAAPEELIYSGARLVGVRYLLPDGQLMPVWLVLNPDGPLAPSLSETAMANLLGHSH